MTVSLNSNALLVSMAELNQLSKLALTDADIANSIINAASDFIARYTKRSLKTAAYTAEKYNGQGGSYLFLKQYPVTAITTIVLWDTVSNAASKTYAENTDYLYDLNEGWLYLREGFQIGVLNYRITYTAGYTTLPYDLRQACAMYAEWMYNNFGKTGMSSESLGDYSYQLDVKDKFASIGGIAVPASILSVLSKFVKVDIS